jgi:hypothetical protein
MTIRVTVEDLETGDKDVAEVGEGDYIIIAHHPCHVAHTNVFSNGRTHQVTIKGRIPE